MSNTADVDRADKKKSFYTPDERKFIDPFKDEYMAADSTHKRRHIAVTKIFLPLFNYWHDERVVVEKERACAHLLAWIRNNWRYPTVQKAKYPLTVKRTTALWHNHREEVWAEIAALLAIPTANAQTPNWFSKQSIALGNILRRKTQTELDELDVEVAHIAEKGYPAPLKIQYAEKYAVKRWDKVATEQYKEMGLLTLSFVTRTVEGGALNCELHDRIGPLLGLPGASFETRHKGLVLEIKKLIFAYITDVKDALNGGIAGAAPSGQADPKIIERSAIEVTPAGYPKLMANCDPLKLQKRELELLSRNYIGEHYYLATGRRTRKPPYGKIESDVSRFIEAKYRPADIIWKDPRNMVLEDARKLFQHIQEREATHEISQEEVDRSCLVKSKYPDEEDDTEHQEPPRPKTKPRRKPKPRSPGHAQRQLEMETTFKLLDDTTCPPPSNIVPDIDGQDLGAGYQHSHIPVSMQSPQMIHRRHNRTKICIRRKMESVPQPLIMTPTCILLMDTIPLRHQNNSQMRLDWYQMVQSHRKFTSTPKPIPSMPPDNDTAQRQGSSVKQAVGKTKPKPRPVRKQVPPKSQDPEATGRSKAKGKATKGKVTPAAPAMSAAQAPLLDPAAEEMERHSARGPSKRAAKAPNRLNL
ncbi:hypothetical protein BJ912DRAFT_927055 [Pholiota molesta]|nr:hypothetical protein BJ912DRAFT_927055 [Pholiota molesta]